ncbi:AAA family ATPase [Falsiroseomonas sp. HW251]|uniref:AAA family ATPase n=1 Tax=Falsiroseomonas sp. HW251 TaxID=3390998 RepID=UPI003D3145EE
MAVSDRYLLKRAKLGRVAPCPLPFVARAMVSQALAKQPDLARAATRPSAAIVVEVPHEEWVNEVAEAWRELVLATEEVPNDGDDESLSTARWVEFRCLESSTAYPSRVRGPDGRNRVAAALARGQAVYGFSPDPSRLPQDLCRVADRTVWISPLSGERLRQAVSAYCKKEAKFQPTDEQAGLVMPGDLLLSVRPEPDPDEMLRRTVDLASARRGKPVDAPRLGDLHGMDAAVEWGHSLARDLSDYRSGQLSWSAIDRGALICGPTGTGKTTFARALAQECSVPLVVGSVAAWQASGTGHLGDMLRAMRDTFSEARKLAPCILFVDEMDSLGNRTRYEDRNRDYGVQVINSFLELVDGIENREGVVLIGATNHPEALDKAILRPGRLDRSITIDLPDAKALEGIMRHHLAADLRDADLSDLARRATGHSGAHVEQWIRSARRTARHQGRPLEHRDLDKEVPNRAVATTPETLWRVAIHEAGHALAISVLRPGALRSVTITPNAPNGSFGSVEWISYGPGDVDRNMTRETLVTRLAERLAGRAAEAVVLGQASSGAGGTVASDLAQATWLAVMGVSAFSLDADGQAAPSLWMGPIPPEDVPSLLAAQPELAARANALLAEGHQVAVDVVNRGQGQIERIAALLLERSSVSGQDVEALLGERGAARSRTSRKRPPSARRPTNQSVTRRLLAAYRR